VIDMAMMERIYFAACERPDVQITQHMRPSPLLSLSKQVCADHTRKGKHTDAKTDQTHGRAQRENVHPSFHLCFLTW
jgi:hypothetical protein